MPADPLVVVLIGPGGAGKGTVADGLTARDPRIWLSRSWTTRPPRPGEASDAYVFVDPETFRRRVEEGGFLEWAEFLGACYGTPIPSPPPGHDVLLEIDVQGAEQVLERQPGALVVLLLPPSEEVQRQRMAARGDRPEQIERRLAKGVEEVARARKLAAATIVNDDVGRAVAELAGIIGRARSARKDP